MKRALVILLALLGCVGTWWVCRHYYQGVISKIENANIMVISKQDMRLSLISYKGDTLFCESVGRTDFPGGSAAQLRQSVQALLSLEGDKTVYPGHDEPTTLSHERKYNPFR